MSIAGKNKFPMNHKTADHGTLSMDMLSDEMRTVTEARLLLFKGGIESLNSWKENPENFLLVDDADLYVNIKTGEVAIVKNT